MKKICKICVSDSSINSLSLDENQVCQFCHIHNEMEKEYPLNDKSFDVLIKISKKIRADGLGKKYNCIVGVSGGKDSSYLLYLVKKKLNLNPLAVHYDNGFNSETSVSNILKICEQLDVDLVTKVADWNTFKTITRSFFMAGVSDPDTPTDIGIFKTMYETAYKEKIKYVFNGHSFRTEGIEPLDWTYMDGLYLKNIHKLYGDGNIENFENFELSDLIKFNILGQIKTILPLNYIKYDEKKVIEELQKNFDWINYGGHHHESLLTKFIVSYYLPKKFKIDRRRTGISAMIRSKKITREEGLEILSNQPFLNDENELKEYILDKLDISEDEFLNIINSENKNFKNFTTYYNYFKHYKLFAKLAYKIGFIPKILYLRYFGGKF
jgi:N-acetyl sugar amidotransferase